jgi:flagellar biosynthesis protein
MAQNRPQNDEAKATAGFDPDQIAVALHHDRGSPHAPKIVATGRGAVAEQILQLAFANGVKVRQDADLAEILASVDVDTEIPLEAFAAVAEILSYVYRANGETPTPTEEHTSTDGQTQANTP